MSDSLLGEFLTQTKPKFPTLAKYSNISLAFACLKINDTSGPLISNKLGFKNSKNMTLQTLLGSVLLMLSSKHEPEELKRKVKSKGGTTEAALSILESSEGMQKLLERAIKKAAKRSVDLSKN